MLILVLSTAPATADDSSIFTLWPIADYRASHAVDYQSLHLLGPFLKHENKGFETEYALRPLFYRAVDDEGVSQTEVLYPAFGHRREKGGSSFHLFHLLNYDFGDRETGSGNRSYLFPFLFYGEDEKRGNYWAFFPLGGTLYNWFRYEEISFVLFPLYSRTQRGTTRTDNVLWPIFARISGEEESGFRFWPFYGQSSKQGEYRKKFFLWPIFFSESVKLHTDNPMENRAVWPLYYSHKSPEKSYQSWLWPFFSKAMNYQKDYTVWNAPWPLVRVTHGEKYHGLRLLPFYADETLDVKRQRWYLWPIYKIEEMHSDLIERRRDRVLFFLYSDLKEVKPDTGESLRRITLWPLFGFERKNGVSHLHFLSLLEPLFPDNQGIERSWSPLWRVYQQKWDRQGNQVVSLLWNLFWREKQGERVAWELFPLMEYRTEAAGEKDFRLLKGLLRYRSDSNGKTLNLFFLPWGLKFGTSTPDSL